MATAFAQVLKELAVLAGAVSYEGEATAGAATTLTDAIGFDGIGDDVLNDLRIYIWQGTGVGQERRITDFGSNAVTVAAWTTNPDTDSRYIVLRQGWRMFDLRNAFQIALNSIRWRRLLPKVDDTLVMASSGGTTTYAYDVPSGFVAIRHILREDKAGESHFVDEIPHDWWYINKTGTRQIIFDKKVNDLKPFILDGYYLRLIGQQFETVPDDDTDNLTINYGTLLPLAAAYAHAGRVPTDTQNARRHNALVIESFQRFGKQEWDESYSVTPGSQRVEDI